MYLTTFILKRLQYPTSFWHFLFQMSEGNTADNAVQNSKDDANKSDNKEEGGKQVVNAVDKEEKEPTKGKTDETKSVSEPGINIVKDHLNVLKITKICRIHENYFRQSTTERQVQVVLQIW